MGTILKITCKSCGRSWECPTGNGMQHFNLSSLTDLFPEDAQKEINAYASQEMFPVFNFAFRPAYCPTCNRIESIPVLSLSDGRGFTGNCRHCGQKPELPENIEKIHCPACGKQTLEALSAGLWD